MTAASVVIATKDRRESLHRALDSLQRQTHAPPFEIVVVDNGSSDDTARSIAAYAQAPVPVRLACEPQPNRGKARNRGVDIARGRYVLFCDDDVSAPQRWVAAHVAAHDRGDRVVNGPILNVPDCDATAKPRPANYSRAFLCTCNASVRRDAFLRVGGFDEDFDLYGWEDTELGVRLRAAKLRWKFAWDAYILHVKPETENSLEEESRKALEKARMARRFVAKHASRRAKLATGAYAFNLWRARHLLPDSLLALYAGIATSRRAPDWVRALGRRQLLDALYTRELARTRATDER